MSDHLNLQSIYNTKCYVYTTLICTVILFIISLLQCLSALNPDDRDLKDFIRINLTLLILYIAIVLAGIDLLFKVCECINWLRKRKVRQEILKKMMPDQNLADDQDEIEDIQNYLHDEDARFDLNRVVILTDMVLSIIFFILFSVERT